MPDSEWNTKREGIVVKKEGIHTEKELTEFLVQEENIRDLIDTVQYKLILIPDYSEDKSILILKSHHCFTDGMGYATYIQTLCDEYDSDSLPGLKTFSLCKQFIIALLAPFITLKGLI